MAGFRKDKTTSANAAAMTAGDIVAALVSKGVIKDVDGAVEAQGDLFDSIFNKLGPVVDADNALFAEVEGQQEAAPKAGPKKTTSAPKAERTKSDGGAKFKGDADAAADLELNSGKFKGCTIGEVFAMDADEAAEKNHREGEPGATYVTWLSTEKNPNGYTREAAEKFLAAQDG